jgi:hypothetical protein
LIDHILPVSRGGTNAIDNVQPLCRKCNSEKLDSYIDFRSPIQIGATLSIFKKTIGGEIRQPELWTVLSVSEDEIEFQSGDDIIVIRRPE